MVGVWCEDAGATALPRFNAWMVSLTSGLVRVIAFGLPGLYLVLFALPAFGSAKLAAALSTAGARAAWGEPSSLVWLPGTTQAWLGAGACVAAMILAFWSLRVASSRFADEDHAGGVLGLAATVAIVVVLAGSAVMPAYDHQRSYRPIAELARTEMERGRRVALATHDAQIVGLFVFYTGQPLPLIEPIPGTRTFLEETPPPSGVVVRRDQLDSVERSLDGVDHEVRRLPEDAGVNSREFCLVTR
jgi:hypothetical protein